MRKVLHVTYDMGIGGAERALYQLIRGQIEAKVSPSLILLARSGYYGKQVAALGVPVHELDQRNAFDFAITRPFTEVASLHDCVHFHTQTPVLMRAIGHSAVTASAYTHRGGEIRAYGKRRFMHYIAGKLIGKYMDAVSGNTRHALNCAIESTDCRMLKPSSPTMELTSPCRTCSFKERGAGESGGKQSVKCMANWYYRKSART